MGRVAPLLGLLVAWLAVVTDAAADELRIDGGTGAWEPVRESSRFVSVAPESVWVWPTEAGLDLVPGSAERGGGIFAQVLRFFAQGLQPVLVPKPGLPAWIDGDGTTAWSPDEDDELERRASLYIDLGASFGVRRLRLAPRLDAEHRGLVLGSFTVATHAGGVAPSRMLQVDYDEVAAFTDFFPNTSPVVDLRFAPRTVRFVRLRSEETEPWELAQVQFFADGTVPRGEFVSQPLFVRGAFPIWGRVRINGDDAGNVPVLMQTRTGPDDEPVFYFLRRGTELERTSRATWLAQPGQPVFGTIEVEQGPVQPNPAWSPWSTVADGQITSPSPARYLQFRLLLGEPGFAVRSLTLEYEPLPLADRLRAEISPTTVDAGADTTFVLSLDVRRSAGRGDSGFRRLDVRTPAVVRGIESVRINDEDVVFTPRIDPGEGFQLDLWRRVLAEAAVVEVVFRAAVLRDGTTFGVRVLDFRTADTGTGVEEVYQSVDAGEVDEQTVGATLTVRLSGEAAPSLVDLVSPRRAAFSPDGDGRNDRFEVTYNLLKVTRAVPVRLEVFAIDGRRVRAGRSRSVPSGQYSTLWDGRDDSGRRVPPGLYLFRVEVDTDAGTRRQAGTVAVVY